MKLSKKSVYIDTYGCANNQAESQIMAGILKESGYKIIDDENKADLVVVNTCSVKNKTESKILHRLSSLSGSEKKLIVAGCLPEADKERVKRFAPNSSIVSTNHISKISVAADFAFQGEVVEFVGKAREEKVNVPKIRTNSVIDIIPISNGCLSSCTFCSTKLAKGGLFSYNETHIINEVQSAKSAGGAKEFWLTSQDCGCYGFENKSNAANLLRNIISNVSGTYFLRLGMSNPQHVKRFLPDLIDVYKDDHVFKFLHIPVQSGSNSILRKMARGHFVEDFTYIVNEFRKHIPEVTIWTDIIVGFPTETEDDFVKSIDLVKDIRPDIVNISSYSVRPGTRAAKMKQLSTEIKKDRTTKISDIAKSVYTEQNRKWIGWKGQILIDEYSESHKNWIGRNYTYKPVVIKNNALEMGQLVDIEVVDCTHNCLIGEIVQ